MKVLSFVARPPLGFSMVDKDHLRLGDGNIAAEQVLKQMQDAKASGTLKYQAQVETAAYVLEIALVLKKLKGTAQEPDVIQIVGHGSPGRLELGRYWTQETSEPQSNLGPSVLDSSPDSYGMLHGWLPADCRVVLVGCLTGALASSGNVANGPTLLFDIEQMSNASAYASDIKVRLEHFKDGFSYQGSLVGSNGKPAHPFELPPPPLRPSDFRLGIKGSPSKLRLKKLVSAPVLGLLPRDKPYLKLADKILRDLSSRYAPVQLDQQLLAMTELEFSAVGYSKPAQLICSGEFLRVFDDQEKKTNYFMRQATTENLRPQDLLLTKFLDSAELVTAPERDWWRRVIKARSGPPGDSYGQLLAAVRAAALSTG